MQKEQSTDHNSRDYLRISDAIQFIMRNLDKQPSLEELSQHINISPVHCHRLFTQWTGITPKNFLQFATLENAKHLLPVNNTLEVSNQSGLSSNSRLHDHFVNIEAITPGEFKSKGMGIIFYWGLARSLFGDVFLCWTEKGIHQLYFINKDELDNCLNQAKTTWLNAEFHNSPLEAQSLVEKIFRFDGKLTHKTKPLSLWVRGTNFQVNVWKALLNIPQGSLTYYGKIASQIHKPKACRAVGTAVGSNPVSFLIPCHRVIQQSGVIGNYRWGKKLKRVLLAMEQSPIG